LVTALIIIAAVLDHARLLVQPPDHVAGRVLHEHERCVALVGEQDELGRLLRLVHEQDTLGVGQDADGEAVDRGPAGDEAGPVASLVLVEAGAVDDAGDHVARVEGRAEVDRRDAEEVVRVVSRLVGGRRGARAELGPMQRGDDLPADADAVALVHGEVVGQARRHGVHGRPTELLVVGLLTSRHLHQRRAAEKDLGLLVHEHRVVADPGRYRRTRFGTESILRRHTL
jgi:hypothetical protein